MLCCVLCIVMLIVIMLSVVAPLICGYALLKQTILLGHVSLASGGSTVAEQSTHNPMIKGSNTDPAA
jgi:hypothetical protein